MSSTSGFYSAFVGQGSLVDYPAYLVKFTVTGGTHYSDDSALGFWIADGNPGNGNVIGSDSFGGDGSIAGVSGLLAAVSSYLEENGWDGGTVSDLTVTKYTEETADVTP